MTAPSIASVLETIEARCREAGGRVALRETTGRSLTYETLWQQVEAVSVNLEGAGLRRGDHVLFAVRPRLESIVLVLAIARLGGVIVALNPTVGPALLTARLAQLRPRWLIAEPVVLAGCRLPPMRWFLSRRGINLPDIGAFAGCEVVRIGRWLPGAGARLSWEELSRGKGQRQRANSEETPPAEPPVVPLDAGDPLFVVFTSGTTEAPRAVVHSERSVAATMRLCADLLRLEPRDVVYCADLHLVLPALMAGATAVLPRRKRFSAEALLADLEIYGVTHLYGLPADLETVAAHHAETGACLPDRLKAVLLGSAPVYAPFLRRFEAAVDPSTEVWCIYAMTEMLPVSFVSLREKLAFEGEGDLVGRPVAGVDVAIADDGELIVAGENLFDRYASGPAATEHATGDLATIDGEGRIVLLGRKKDMIIKGDLNIYPGLIEPVIARIEGVGQCALVGVYDEARSDERVVLAVEPAPGADTATLERDLRRELRSGAHSIAPGAQPDAIVLTTLPRSGRSRKVDKVALRELVRDRLR